MTPIIRTASHKAEGFLANPAIRARACREALMARRRWPVDIRLSQGNQAIRAQQCRGVPTGHRPWPAAAPPHLANLPLLLARGPILHLISLAPRRWAGVRCTPAIPPR